METRNHAGWDYQGAIWRSASLHGTIGLREPFGLSGPDRLQVTT